MGSVEGEVCVAFLLSALHIFRVSESLGPEGIALRLSLNGSRMATDEIAGVTRTPNTKRTLMRRFSGW